MTHYPVGDHVYDYDADADAAVEQDYSTSHLDASPVTRVDEPAAEEPFRHLAGANGDGAGMGQTWGPPPPAYITEGIRLAAETGIPVDEAVQQVAEEMYPTAFAPAPAPTPEPTPEPAGSGGGWGNIIGMPPTTIGTMATVTVSLFVKFEPGIDPATRESAVASLNLKGGDQIPGTKGFYYTRQFSSGPVNSEQVAQNVQSHAAIKMARVATTEEQVAVSRARQEAIGTTRRGPVAPADTTQPPKPERPATVLTATTPAAAPPAAMLRRITPAMWIAIAGAVGLGGFLIWRMRR